jgi:hypothetical protein
MERPIALDNAARPQQVAMGDTKANPVQSATPPSTPMSSIRSALLAELSCVAMLLGAPGSQLSLTGNCLPRSMR